MPNSKDLPSSLVQLRIAVWTGVTRDTRPNSDNPRWTQLGEVGCYPLGFVVREHVRLPRLVLVSPENGVSDRLPVDAGTSIHVLAGVNY